MWTFVHHAILSIRENKRLLTLLVVSTSSVVNTAELDCGSVFCILRDSPYGVFEAVIQNKGSIKG